MKNLKPHVIALILFMTIGISSCSKEDDPSVTTKKAFAITVEGPETGISNKELIFSITYGVENSCVRFNKFTETTTDNAKTISIETIYENKICTQVPLIEIATYKFTPTATGTYILKFEKSATDYITKTVIINSAS